VIPARTFSAEFRAGVRATLSVSLKGVKCQWTPDLPRNLPLADREALMASYRAWRDECLAEFARDNGMVVHTAQVDGVDVIAFRQPEVAP
jgi:hypothetical protein